MGEYFLTRVEQPRIGDVEHDVLDPQVGGQWEWCWAVSLPYRAVNTPSVGAPMPAAPRSGVDFMQYLGYWTALQSFLTYSFGWTRHDRGLRWWYDAGKPIDDPRLALLDAVWERDGTLLAYAEWCHDSLGSFGHQPLAQWTNYDSQPEVLTPEWELRFRVLSQQRKDDGTTPHGKHLEGGDHAAGPAADHYEAVLTVTDSSARRAVYTSRTALGWYRGLVELGAKLPPSSDASWRVDVYVQLIGFVGTYRRSRKTGLWFAGRHRFHSVGNG
jgi:hypothetical protein